MSGTISKELAASLMEATEAFNSLYPIGTDLILFNKIESVKITTRTIFDGIGGTNTTTRTLMGKARIVGGKAVAPFDCGSDGIKLCEISLVKILMRRKQNQELGISYLVPCDAHGEFIKKDRSKMRKVKCVTLLGGYDPDEKNARKYLQVGKYYQVDKVEVGSWHTNIYLSDFPGIKFNSVFFDTETENQ